MNLKDLARARGTNLKRVAEQSGIPASTLYAISSGETNFDNVGIGVFKRVANALGMTADELYMQEITAERDEREDNETMRLSDDERELLDCYRALSADEREHVMFVAKMAFLHVRKG